MSNLSQPSTPANSFNRSLVLWADRRILWLSQHWLAAANIFFLLYVGLPFLAPVLMAFGYSGAANLIYWAYQVSCHQLPSRSYFIFGEQVAFCQRDVAIYGSLFLGGLLFGLVRDRLRPIKLRWYVFFLVPIALDGGLQMASSALAVVPIATLWAIGLVAMGLTSAILHSRRYLTWHSYLFFAFGPLSLIYLQFVAHNQYLSNPLNRSITGFIFAIGTVWFAYPYVEESFKDIHQVVKAKLVNA